MLRFTRLLERFVSAPIDDDRHHGLLGLNTVGSTPLPLSGFSLSGVGALAIAIVDGTGNQITSFGGGTQYTDAGTPPAHPVGNTLEWNNGGTWATVGSAAPLPVAISTGSAVIGHVITDSGSVTSATLAAETTKVIGTINIAAAQTVATVTNLSQIATTVPIFGAITNAANLNGAIEVVPGIRYDATQPTLTDTRFNMLQATQRGALIVGVGTEGFAVSQTGTWNVGTVTTLTGITNVVHIDDNAGSLTVDNAGTFAVQATLAAETTKVIGVARTADGAGNLLTSNSTTYTAKFGLDGNLLGTLGTAFSTAGKVDVKGADGDVFVRQATGSNLHMVVDSGTVTTVSTVTAVTSITNQVDVNLKQVAGSNTLNGGVAGSQSVGGTVATNVAITANPLNLGVQAVSSENSAVTTARQVQLVADLVGKLIVLPYANPENFTNGTTAAIVDTTTTSVIATQGVGIRTYITQITVTNSHATVGTFVKITDGASTILHEGYAAAAGGGYTATFPTPLRGTANTAVNAICVTTGANVIASVSGYKGA